MSKIKKIIIGSPSPSIRVNYQDGTAVSVAVGDWDAADSAGVRDIANTEWDTKALSDYEAMKAEAQLRFEAEENA